MKNYKQIINLLATAVIAISLTACGGEKKESSNNNNTNVAEEKVQETFTSITPLKTSVKGDLKGYIEVVSGDYKIVKKEEKWVASVKIKNIKKHKKTEYDQDPGQEITLKFYDKDEKPIDLKSGFRIYEQNNSTIGSFITSEPGEEEWLELSNYTDFDKAYPDQLPSEIKFFALETRAY